MIKATDSSRDHQFRTELIDITRRIAPEKLGKVLESLSPNFNIDQIRFQCTSPGQHSVDTRSRGKQLLEQALSIFK